MIERKQLNNLVVATLSKGNLRLKAVELYTIVKEEAPTIFREEKVRGFRSFVKIINTFEDINIAGKGVKEYSVKKCNHNI